MELLKDKSASWRLKHRLRQSAAFAANTDLAIVEELKGPDIDMYPIDVSFAELKDKAEYLNGLPTSFVLPPEAVDRLRAAAGTIMAASPEFQRLLKDVGAKVVTAPTARGSPAAD